MTVVFAVYAKLEKTLSISCWLAIKKISQNLLRNTCVAYEMDFNIKNLLGVAC